MKNRKNKYLVESARITDAYFNMYAKRVNEDAYSIGNTIGNIGYKAKQFVGNSIKGGVEFGKGIKDGFNGYGKKSANNVEPKNYGGRETVKVSWQDKYENDPNYEKVDREWVGPDGVKHAEYGFVRKDGKQVRRDGIYRVSECVCGVWRKA